jgi:deazaflavin-dependent oxidoreductase (nitroreductase family)
MSDKPPQYQPPLPYPYGVVKWLMKSPIILYRFGFGPLIGERILILTTTGRKSGLPRQTAIEHRRFGNVYYIVSGWGSRADWYHNILKNPRVRVWAGRREFYGMAGVLNLVEKREATRMRWGKNEQRAIRSLFHLKAEPTDEQITELMKRTIIVRIKPF